MVKDCPSAESSDRPSRLLPILAHFSCLRTFLDSFHVNSGAIQTVPAGVRTFPAVMEMASLACQPPFL